MDNYPISSNSLEKFYYIDGTRLAQQYKDHLSDFQTWEQKKHSEDWILFPENLGPYLSLDETSITQGELYTILTNKDAKGKKGAIVAMIKGTESENVISILKQIPYEQRKTVKEITLDMAASMNKIANSCFGSAVKVIDRFHVQKLAYDAMQEMRIASRWDAINLETNLIQQAREENRTYKARLYSNGDTLKQLLARSRYLLFKSREKWVESQKKRAKILFELYPDIKKAYELTHDLRLIFSKTVDKSVAYTKLAQWYNDVTEADYKSFIPSRYGIL